ncbi:ABC transporter substrate-binding protein [Amphibacillus sp. Q70]|uniref:ABC transporter substrate-binding protein n=1 Tax=Amphibacillus sp. Q70 TaxID=3453416 RepID=UPI003F871267
MNFRKICLFLLSIIFVVTLVACGGDNSDESEGEEADESPVEKITIFQSKVEISEQLENLAVEYEEETGIEVEVWGTTGDDYFQQLQVRLNSNQGPTIFNVSDLNRAQAIESYMYDMSNEDYIQYFSPDMEMELDGKIIGAPFGVEGFGLVYNKDLVDPEDITDLDSFVNTLEQFESEGINGLQLAREANFLIGHISNYPFALQEDDVAFMESLNNGEVTMAEVEEFQEFEQFMAAIKEYNPNPLEVSYDDQIGNFATGQTAMIHQGNWAYGMFEDYDLDFEIGMMPFPLKGNDKLAVGVGTYWAINANKDEAEIEAGNDFLEWLFTSETGKRYNVEEFGFIPAQTNVDVDGHLDPLSQEIFEASSSGDTIPWSFRMYPTNLVPNDFFPVAEEYFLIDDVNLIEGLDEAWQSRVE